MSKNILRSLVIVAIVVVAAFVLNPSPERHREAIRQAVAERSQLAAILGVGALSAFASTYHPLGVASYTSINGRVTSIGLLGMVFVL